MQAGVKHIALLVSKVGKPRMVWSVDSEYIAQHRRKAGWIATLSFELHQNVDGHRDVNGEYWFSIKGSLDYDDQAHLMEGNHRLDPFYFVAFAQRSGAFWGQLTSDPDEAAAWRQKRSWVATLRCEVMQVFYANHTHALCKAQITTADRLINVAPKIIHSEKEAS